jgi:hypothetical protein
MLPPIIPTRVGSVRPGSGFVIARTIYPDSMKIRSGDRALALTFACAGIALSALRSRAVELCPPATCAPEDLSCRAAVAVCELKIRAFEIYMEQIDTGQPKYPLPEIYQEVLRPHYPQANLAEVRFAFSDQQPPDNATTDCNDIYFNDASFVEALRSAGPNRKLLWLLHELAHPEQCAASGGRKGYAKRWWDELEAAVRASGETIDLFQSTEELAKQLRKLYARVHGTMPMEQAADAKAAAVLESLRGCCIAEDGTPIRPATD